jgi:hypothetical protein
MNLNINGIEIQFLNQQIFLKIMSNKEKSAIDQLNTARHSQIEKK